MKKEEKSVWNTKETTLLHYDFNMKFFIKNQPTKTTRLLVFILKINSLKRNV